jgi:hypothetical protein
VAAENDDHNRRGIKLPFQLSEVLRGVSSIVSIAVVLIGLVVWSARQEGRIGELEHRVKNDEAQLADLDRRGTREMAERTGLLAQDINALKASYSELQKRVDLINSAGSQAGLLLAERVGNDARQSALTRERMQVLDARDEEFNKRLSAQVLDAQKINGHLDLVDAEAKRLSEQQARMLQAIDATYNLLQEHLRNGQIHTPRP